MTLKKTSPNCFAWDQSMAETRADYGSAWKEVLERFFEEYACIAGEPL
jgi:hypothetical protein